MDCLWYGDGMANILVKIIWLKAGQHGYLDLHTLFLKVFRIILIYSRLSEITTNYKTNPPPKRRVTGSTPVQGAINIFLFIKRLA
jgi:hypothetical protein